MSVRRAVVFASATLAPIYYALEGGAFDSIPRNVAAIGIWGALAAGLGLGVLPRARIHRGLIVALTLLLAFAAWTAFSLLWTDSAERTVAEVARCGHYLALLAAVACLLDRYTWTAAAAGLTAAAVGVSLLALCSRLFPDLIAGAGIVSQIAPGRLSYPLDYWNALGAWAAMALAMTLAWSAHAERPATRAVALSVAPAIALTIYLTASRGAVLGVLVGGVVILAASRNRFSVLLHMLVAGAGAAVAIGYAEGKPEIASATGGAGGGAVLGLLIVLGLVCGVAALATASAGADRWRMRPQMARVGVRLLAALVTVLAAVALLSGLADSAWESFRHDGSAPSTELATRATSFGGDRAEIWDTALDTFGQRPLNGVGAGTFEFQWAQDGNGRTLIDAHSLYLEQLAELGVVGLVLMVAFLAALTAAAIAARRHAATARRAGAAAAMLSALAIFIVQAGVDWFWEYTAVGVLGLGAGAVAAMGLAGAGSPPPALPVRARLLAGAVAILGLAIAVPEYLSTTRVRDSQTAIAEHELGRATELADSAITVAPWAASAYAQRSRAAEASGDYRGARADLLTAIAKEPDNWRHQLELARVEAKAANPEAAFAALDAGRTLNPRSEVVEQAADEVRVLLAKHL